MSTGSPIQKKGSMPWMSLCALIAGNFMLILDVFIVNVALNEIRIDLGATEAELQAIVVAYSIAFGALLMNGARLGDIFGRRRIYLIGVTVFLAASMGCGLAQTAWVLIGARVVQGVGASMMMPQVYSSIRVIYSGEAQSRAFSAMGAAQGLAGIVSQLLGGILIFFNKDLGWRLVFFVNIPVGLLILFFGRIFIPETRDGDRTELDIIGAGLGAGAVSLFLASFMEGRQYGWPMWSFGLLLGAIFLLTMFLRCEDRVKARGGVPIVDTEVFRIGHFGLGICAIFLLYSSIGSFSFVLTMLLQRGLGMSPLEAGVLFTPSAVAFLGGSLLFPVIQKTSRWNTLSIGTLVFASGILIAILNVYMEKFYIIFMIISLVIVGLGQGITIPSAISFVIGGLDAKKAGMASGTVSTMQMTGAAFGVALVGVIFFYIIDNSSGNNKAFSNAFSISIIYNFLSVIISGSLFGWIDGSRKKTINNEVVI